MSLGTVLVFLVILALGSYFEAQAKKRQHQGQGAPPRPHNGGAQGDGARGVGAGRGEAHLPRPGGEQSSQLPRRSESAQVLLPDELWAILTGETRPTTSPPAPQLPEESMAQEDWERGDWEERGSEREAEEEVGFGALPAPSGARERFEVRTASGRDEDEVDDFVTLTGEPLELRSREGRELVVRKGRKVALRPRGELSGRSARELVSYDDYIPTDRERHDAFHRRLDAATADSSAARMTAAERHAARHRQLRNAIIMREVLGPPRGLEDPF